MMVIIIMIVTYLAMKITLATLIIQKKTKFILEDNIAKKLNNYLLMKKMENKNLIKYKSFTRSPVIYMYDHLQPII